MSDKTKWIAAFLLIFLFASFISVSAEEDNAKEAKQKKVLEKVREISKNSLVKVEIYFRDPTGLISPVLIATDMVSNWRGYWQTEKPYFTSGALFGDDKVLITNLDLLPELIKEIKVRFFDGEILQARLEEYIVEADGFILGLEKKRAKLGALFVKCPKPKFNDEFFYSLPGTLNIEHFRINYGSTTIRFDISANAYALFFPRQSLVFNSEGAPVGFIFDNSAEGVGNMNNWIAVDFLSGKRKSVAGVREYRKKLPELIGKEIMSIRFEVRGKRAGSDDPVMFGILLDGNGTVLVPSLWTAETIKNIKRIIVSVNGKEIVASFIGQLAHYSAFLIRVPGLVGPSKIVDLRKDMSLFNLYYALSPYSIAMKPDAVAYSFRLFGYTKLFDGKIYKCDRDREISMDFLFAADNKCIGLYLWYFKEWKNGQFLRDSRRGYYVPRSRSGSEASVDFAQMPVLFSRLMDIVAAPSAHIVPNIKPMSITEAKKTVWLGLEIQGLNRNLAEYLDIMEETNYGEKGGRVVWVYPGSPAHKAGINIGDVLLVVKKKGSTSKIEMRARMFSTSWWYRRYPWSSRRTDLVKELTKFGVGSDIEITFLRGKGKMATKMKLEASPPDFESAPLYKCWELGFRVKDITYEVRKFFNLKKEITGVIVYRIESGSKARIAEMNSFDIIVKVNKKPVRNVEEFKAVINEAIDGPAETVNIEILRLGVTRFLEIKKPSPEDIKKIREEHQFDTAEEEEETPPVR